MYNVATGLFLGDNPSSTSYAMVNLDGNDMYLEQTDDNWYLHKNAASGYNLYGYSSNQTYYNSSQSKNYVTWIITEAEGNYTLKTLQNKDAEIFLGVDDANKVYSNKTEKIEWQFMPSADAAHYAAEVKLYNALAAADDKGWAIDSYRALYDGRATATTLQLNQAAEQLVQAVEFSAHTGIFDPLNDYKMMFNMNGYRDSRFYDDYVSLYAGPSNSATFTALVETTADAELFYTLTCHYTDNQLTMKVYIDDVLVRTIEPYLLRAYSNNVRLFEKIVPGKHLIKWEIINSYSEQYRYAYIQNIGIANIKPIEVHLAEPGSLGTEVLYNVDHVRDVRYLKIVGDMNEEDAVRLSMMTNMLSLDMSEATITNIPEQTFSYSNTPYLHKVVLPEGLKTIGIRSFNNPSITDVNIPSTVESIDHYCFASSNITDIYIPDAVSSLGTSVFKDCYILQNVHYSAGLTTVPSSTFENCLSLNTCNLPEGITDIQSYAFNGCKYGTFNPILPSTLQEIGESAFYNCNGMTEIVIPDAVTNLRPYCFSYCEGLEKATVSMNIYEVPFSWDGIFGGCKSLKVLTMRSATVAKSDNKITYDEYRPNITLRVPQYLVNSYKLDPYWYNFGAIEGFSTADTKDWTIHADLTLDSHSRFEGEPNIELKKSNFRIVGDLPMTIDNFITNGKWDSFDWGGTMSSMNWSSQVMSKCDNISVIGNCFHNVEFTGQKWLCMALPFDTKLGNIKSMNDDVLFAVRVYDGAKRATEGTGANWTRIYDDEYVIPAGTGFIIQASQGSYIYNTIQFKSLENDSRNNILNNQDFVKSLDINACELKANMGWNLVGNPYLTYYNIHKLNFTAPITIYDSNKGQYFAYSITDDDYALMPTQGFFVQCPGDEVQTIGFPVSGKQFTDEITEQNAAKGSKAKAAASRQIIDLTISSGDNADKTRVVLNESASTDYEVSCDASKFMSDSKDAVQLWTIDDNGTQYAINERPMADGIVALGVSFPADGTYTFDMPRCLAQDIVLYDSETNVETDLTTGNYTFSANAGIDTKRFVLRTKSGTATGIVSHAGSLDKTVVDIYSMDGRFLMKANGNFNVESLPQGMYVVRKNGETQKVVIK